MVIKTNKNVISVAYVMNTPHFLGTDVVLFHVKSEFISLETITRTVSLIDHLVRIDRLPLLCDLYRQITSVEVLTITSWPYATIGMQILE